MEYIIWVACWRDERKSAVSTGFIDAGGFAEQHICRAQVFTQVEAQQLRDKLAESPTVETAVVLVKP